MWIADLSEYRQIFHERKDAERYSLVSPLFCYTTTKSEEIRGPILCSNHSLHILCYVS